MSFPEVSQPSRGIPLTPEQAMQLALHEATLGFTRVSPNPPVGAVVLDSQGRFLAAGHHEFYGGPHAEVNALKNLSEEELKGAHVFVTLEPCAHQGKTPSCARMMAKLPIAKVTYGLVDPNPLVAGQGAAILKEAGIQAELFSSADPRLDAEIKLQLEEVCEAFLWNFRYKKVFVAIKMASSLDGQVALKSGESQWITGPESREHVHYLRACYDAVLVGKKTIEFDNPSLNIRHPHITKKNKVVVIDAEGDLLPKLKTLKLMEMHEAQDVIWCVSADLREAIEQQKLSHAVHICYVKTEVGGNLDLDHLLAELWQKGLRSVLVEGGALTASSFVDCRLVNRLYLFQAPILMGSGGSRSWTETLRIKSMEDKIRVKNPRFKLFGNDIMTTGTL